MRTLIKIIIIIGILLFGIVAGLFLATFGEQQLMGEYDLYNCIYTNADNNGFNQHPEMIKTIQDECICFREQNYTEVWRTC